MAATVIPQREIIRFEAGRPETVRLKYATGKEVQGRGGPQFLFTTVDDRIFFVDPEVARSIQQCGVSGDEPVTITKYKGPKNTVNWDVRKAVTGASPTPAPVVINQQDTTPAPTSIAETGPITPMTAKLCACFMASVDAIAEAQRYCARKGLGVTFTNEDVRCVAISAFIQGERMSGGER